MMSEKDKSKALDCVGIYMANYFLPSGEKFEYGMKEKSISTVKVLKAYAFKQEYQRKNGMMLLIRKRVR